MDHNWNAKKEVNPYTWFQVDITPIYLDLLMIEMPKKWQNHNNGFKIKIPPITLE
jgi:hypothetical protein